MDDLPINRASNPFKNQGYMMRLARQRGGGMLGRRSSGRRRQRRRQRGGNLNAYIAMRGGRKVGKNLLDGLEGKEEEESFRPPRCRYLEL